MELTPFHAYFSARMLESLPDEEKLLPVYASSDIQVYPYQVAAASFALRSPWQKGVILCDEAGMGKSHEALLIMAQRYLEGYDHILLCIPNSDLLCQWTDLLERCYSIPYTVASAGTENPFDYSGIVICTYDFAASHEAEAGAIFWDLAVFEEATALSGVYREDNRQARALRRIAGDAFKLLITGTPIEKNILDLYGMIWFIDDGVLPEEQEYISRYLRRPENYPELAERVSRYCFRTLRWQTKEYAKIPERVLLTLEYSPTPEEEELYRLLYAYVNRSEKLAFPEMDPYDLALRLLGLQSSSTAAIRQTITGILRRLESIPEAEKEMSELQAILSACELIQTDSKAALLMKALDKSFAILKQRGAERKAVVFTESAETQKMLAPLVSAKYKTVLYNGNTGYSSIRQFKREAEVLISTDHGARGFNLEDAALIIHYDLLYNTLKKEQRIDRCHRLGQKNDVLSVAFINQRNFADVRKLELVSKRMLVSGGVFGVSDEVIGGFADHLEQGFSDAAGRLRTAKQIEADHQSSLQTHEEENKQLVASAEDMLFTTFTKKLADKVRLSPQYVEKRRAELNAELWELVKYFFMQWNREHEDCRFVIDDVARTVTAPDDAALPVLFYYWDGSRNTKYRSQRQYGMAADFKPRAGRITFSSILGRGILHELECAETGTLQVRGEVAPCRIGLYHVIIMSEKRRIAERSVLVGATDSGVPMSDQQCRELLALPVVSFTENGRRSPQWLKRGGTYDALDNAVPVQALIAEQAEKLSPVFAEEAERLRLAAERKKAALSKDIAAMETRIAALDKERETVTGDRLLRLALDKQLSQLRREIQKRQENRFFDALRVDAELEEQLKALAEREKLTARVTKEFMLKMEGYK